MTRALLSVGIDVGTTTTQVVFSRLQMMDTARAGQVPRITITDRQVLYQSPPAFTPLADHETVDAQRLNELIRREYANAGVNPADVQTGAVIITGETAKKKNADRILQALSGLAGEFVVSVAGPHVESLIAGRGAGAEYYSQRYYTTVTNVDIGGGSANSATFSNGRYLAAAAMNFGGRILEIEHTSGRVRHIAQPAAHILADCGIRLQVGDIPSLPDLQRFCARMADLTQELVEGTRSPLAQKLYLTPPTAVSGKGTVLMISGGIGHYTANPLPIHQLSDLTLHGDVGPLLAQAIRQHSGLQQYEIVPPSETLRATVLGASSQTVSLSGSTIWAEREILPMRNLPVLRPQLASLNPSSIADAIRQATLRWDLNLKEDWFAIVLVLNQALNYTTLNQLAEGVHLFAEQLPPQQPLVLVIERDYAQVLGQTLKTKQTHRPLLVIDQVGDSNLAGSANLALQEGDYIDIGTPLMDGRVVPLSVKTLIFYHGDE